MVFLHSKTFDKALTFERLDEHHLLSTVSAHGFVLEDRSWPSVEHYYQTSKLRDRAYTDKIFTSASGLQAHEMGNRWFKRKRPEFARLRQVLMTRALYCKARQNTEVADFLLSSDDRLLVETSQYDHYWGLGRDQRGQNRLGKIWMDIRLKLREQSVLEALEP